MRFSHLEELAGTLRPIPVELWANAYMMARIRVQANDGQRAKRQDRGHRKNMLNDLIGSFGELICLYLLEQLEPELAGELETKARQMFHDKPGHATRGADLVFDATDLDKTVSVDIKAFDCAGNKRMFTIHDQKHHKLRGKCDWYLGVLSPVSYPRKGDKRWIPTGFGDHAIVTELIDYTDVDSWELWQWRYSGGDQSRFMMVADLIDPLGLPVKFSSSGCVADFPGSTYSLEDVKKVVESDSFKSSFATRYPHLQSYVQP